MNIQDECKQQIEVLKELQSSLPCDTQEIVIIQCKLEIAKELRYYFGLLQDNGLNFNI